MSTQPPSHRGEALERLHASAERPDEVARAWKQRTGRPVVGTFCSYVPEELIVAAGALPFRVVNVPGEFSQADRCLQAYACCLARGALQLGMTDQADFLDGVVFSNTCDTMQCLADIWPANVERGFAETFMVPVQLDGPASREFVIAEIRRLMERLAGHLGHTIEPDALTEAIQACRAGRQALEQLQGAQRAETPQLSPSDYYAAFMARWSMPPTEYVQTIAAVLDDPDPPAASGPRIAVIGGPMYASTLPDVLTELGASWVADDLCTGGRSTWQAPTTADDPVETIADRLLTRPICPTKYKTDHDPGPVAVETVRTAAADGVIMYRLKFCEPHAFDAPRVQQAFDEAGIPNILIEVESPSSGGGQLRTRLQAFIEMLGETEPAEATS